MVGVVLAAGCTGSSSDDLAGGPTTAPTESTGPTSTSVPVATSTAAGPAPTTAPLTTAPTSAPTASTTVAPIVNTPAPIEPVDVTTDDGRLTVGGELPTDLDPLVAIPDDFEVSIGSFTDLSSGVAGTSEQTLDALIDFYVSALRNETGEEPVVEHINDQITRITVSAGNAAATVVLGPGPIGTTSITIDVTR